MQSGQETEEEQIFITQNMSNFDNLNFLFNDRLFFLKKEIQAEMPENTPETQPPVSELPVQPIPETQANPQNLRNCSLLVVVEKLPLESAEQILLQNMVEKALLTLFPEGMKEVEIIDTIQEENLLEKRKLVLFFGTEHQEKLYELKKIQGKPCLYAPTLSVLDKDVNQKKQLWLAFKSILGTIK